MKYERDLSEPVNGVQFRNIYPADMDENVFPLIHFKVIKQDFVEFFVSIYFPDMRDETDRLLQRKTHGEQKRMVVSVCREWDGYSHNRPVLERE